MICQRNSYDLRRSTVPIWLFFGTSFEASVFDISILLVLQDGAPKRDVNVGEHKPY